MKEVKAGDIRRSVIAGSWYPGTKDELEQMLDGFLAKAEKEELEGQLMGLIAPHAGYVYSGQVAAYAYKQLEGLSFDEVAVISPVHRMYVGRFAVTDKAYYETPLGLVEVDGEPVDAIDEAVGLNRLERDNEHSLEIQLPFLQRALGEFKLIPIMMGDQSPSSCQALGKALAKVLKGKGALLVASSDLSHFHRYETALRLDKVVQEDVERYDPEGLMRDIEAGRCEACGGGPIDAVMSAARTLGADRAKVIKYANSGDVTGDLSGVVGYMAAAIYKQA
ncbi:MAG: AmmeMemoRadiSam system protein B [Chloroflexota bacterium]|nr:AmmeMemoRadiSam system protein B [Chloroflexota bacterium]